jgi:hypothetical protein
LLKLLKERAAPERKRGGTNERGSQRARER